MIHVLTLFGYTAYQAQCIAPLMWAMAAGAVCVAFADKI